ncbi:hypothetical protein HY249_00285 [Candidatus Azambacteria bacterium]|nr:hypothetical protein [Candidatus Azambacteria bacterium]
MKNHLLFIEKIKKLAGIKEENFHQATRGTRHNVFISDRYVIRFRDDDNNILLREADLLKTIDNPIIPKVVWTGDVDGVAVMIEARLSGENLDLMWGKISQNDQINLVEQVVNFLLHLKTDFKRADVNNRRYRGNEFIPQ